MIQVRYFNSFRAVAACLLLTPYMDYMAQQRAFALPHPLHAQAAAWVEAQREHPCAIYFRELIERGDYFGSHFYWLAAQLIPEPPFSWINDVAGLKRGLPDDAIFAELQIVERFPALLSSFMADAKLAEFWQVTAAEWQTAREQVQMALAVGGVDDWQASFWGPATRELFLMPNPTEPPCFGFASSNRAQAFALVGPNQVPTNTADAEVAAKFDYRLSDNVLNLAVHELGHSLFDQARPAFDGLVGELQATGFRLELRGWFPEMYPELPIQLEEIILNAVQATYLTECVSRQAGEAFVADKVRQFGVGILRPIYERIVTARVGGKCVGAEGCVAIAREVVMK